MRSFFLVLATGMLLLSRSVAAADCPPAMEPLTPELFAKATQHARDRGMLWSITKDDRVSYLYGTMHVGKAHWLAPGPSLRKALRETEVIALELDPLDAAVQVELTQGTAGIRRNLSAPLAARVKTAWQAQCLPVAALDSGPAELHMVALVFALAMRDGLNPVYGSEIMLSLLAQGLKRPVRSLETVAMQLQALLAQDDAEAERYLDETLAEIEKGKLQVTLTRTAQVWEVGNIGEFEHYADWCECLDTEIERKFMKRVLDDRNPGLAERIDQIHAGGQKVLAAVGVLHMVGPAGLPALLAQRGYQVVRLF